MQEIIMKIKGYDERNHSLIVSWCSDTTKSQNPDDYQALALQPLDMWPDADNQLLLKRIAEMGIHHVQSIERKENISQQDDRIEYLKSLVDQEFRVSVSDMINEINTWQNTNSSNNLVHTV
jgi:hypothetical protein